MTEDTELKDLVNKTVEAFLDDLRPLLVIALSSIAMATLDKAEEINHKVLAQTVQGGGQ